MKFVLNHRYKSIPPFLGRGCRVVFGNQTFKRVLGSSMFPSVFYGFKFEVQCMGKCFKN